MSIAENLRRVRDRMSQACDVAGRDPASVTLIAVTKTIQIDQIREAYDLDLRDFGESRLQEAIPKIEVLPGDIRWHFIGHLQSNKAKRAALNFDVIHTISNENQLRELHKANRPVDALIEVNIAEEPQKSGVLSNRLDDCVRTVLNYDHVHLRGLMTVGPAVENPEAMRPYFRKLRELNESVGLDWISMGMSEDFDVAIQEGSTHIRVGSAIFGSRS